MPGGYIACVVMTVVPGENVWDLKFWSMASEQQNEIRKAFILAIK